MKLPTHLLQGQPVRVIYLNWKGTKQEAIGLYDFQQQHTEKLFVRLRYCWTTEFALLMNRSIDTTAVIDEIVSIHKLTMDQYETLRILRMQSYGPV